YAEKQAHQASERPTIADRDLQRMFTAERGWGTRSKSGSGVPAAAVIRRHRGELRRMVARFTGESQYTPEPLPEHVTTRCGALELRTTRDDRKLPVDFALLLTVRTVHFHYSRRNWVAL